MSRKKVVITAPWPQTVLEALAVDYDLITPSNGETLSGQALAKVLDGANALCPLFYESIDADFIAKLPKSISIIASYGIGTDHIDIEAATARGIVVSNTPDVVTADTADLAIGLMIAAARGFYEHESRIRNNSWGKQGLMDGLGRRVSGKTLGIIGLGAIGQAVAKRAKAFDMRVIYYSRTRKSHIEKAMGIHYVADRDELLAEADIISLHAALTPDTHHMINASSFDIMKNTAVLVNTGRGGLIDEQAMTHALKQGKIMAAGLDVYEYEPELSQGLAELNNVTLMPHIGTATVETREDMGLRVKKNLDHFFQNGTPLDPVY